VLELESGMRPEFAPEICRQMSGLYNFVYRQLVDGCVRREVGPIDEALKILRYQRETWALLMEKLRGATPESGNPQAGGAAERASVGLVVEG
jgi:flagellin-specific chaperone FliS